MITSLRLVDFKNFVEETPERIAEIVDRYGGRVQVDALALRLKAIVRS